MKMPHQKHVLCPNCDGEGLVTFDFENFFECEVCNGFGWISVIEIEKEDDDEKTDP